MMRLITDGGRRVDHPPPTDLDYMILKIRATPYAQLRDGDRRRLKLLLDIQHDKREAIRFPTFDDERR
jgi:hypothetical protein